MPTEESVGISLAQGARRWSVSERHLRRLIADGTLPAYRVGRLIRVKVEELDRAMQPVSNAGGARA